MAVPKKKTSKSKRDMRRAHDFLTAPGISICPQCQEPQTTSSGLRRLWHL